jgi:hypothetical protein
VSTQTVARATEPQRSFITTLRSERVLAADVDARLTDRLPTMDARLASQTITWLLAQPKKAMSDIETATEPEPGYYSVTWNGALRFYCVREGQGRWAGRRFLNRFRSDDLDRPTRQEVKDVYAAILANPAEAQKRFADETVCCYVCGRRLTDAESRELGIGPVCRKEI